MRWSTSGVTKWRISCQNYGNGSAPWNVTYDVAGVLGLASLSDPKRIYDRTVTFAIPSNPALVPRYAFSTLFYGGLYVSRSSLGTTSVARGDDASRTAR